MSKNPFFYLTFLPSVSPEKISEYHFASRIQLPDDNSVEIIKIVDNSHVPTPRIVGFASWKMSYRDIDVPKPRLPACTNSKFLDDFWKKVAPIIEFFDPTTDIDLSLMRVLPEYQGRGLGGMLLRWGLERVEILGKRVFLLLSSEGKYLYVKYGFEIIGEVVMELEEYGG